MVGFVVRTAVGRRAASSAIALKYSKAAYSAALKKSPAVLLKVQTELNAIHRTIKDRPQLRDLIHNPTLSPKDRAAALSTIYTAAAPLVSPKPEPMSELTKNLMDVLCGNGRLGETEGVIEGFNALVAKYKGELSVVVTSATPLPKDVLSRLESALKMSQVGQQSKSLKFTNKVRCAAFLRLQFLTLLARSTQQ